jgi:DNA recombination protein RmuC
VRNAHIKPGIREVVEFAVRIPGSDGSEALLPIDAKFPKEDWERLEDALSRDDKDAAKASRKALLSRIRTEAKKVSDNYISPPATTDMAILCVGTEGLFAEVHREPGFVDELRSQFQIILAGPTTLMAILSSLQMGFKALAIQNKSSEVRNLLAKTKTEFGKFGVLMKTVETQVGTVQNTLHQVGVRTRAINKTLSEVEVVDLGPHNSVPILDSIAEIGEESVGQSGVMLGSGALDFEDETK